MCHMSLASAKPLHANPQYGHKMEGRRCENMGNSAVFGLTEGVLNIVSYAVTTGIGFNMMSALREFIQEGQVYNNTERDHQNNNIKSDSTNKSITFDLKI